MGLTRWTCPRPFLMDVYTNICVFCSTGIDFKIKTVELQGKKIKLQIWWVSASLWDVVFLFVDPRASSSRCRAEETHKLCYIIVKHLVDNPPSSPEICRNRKWSLARQEVCWGVTVSSTTYSHWNDYVSVCKTETTIISFSFFLSLSFSFCFFIAFVMSCLWRFRCRRSLSV